MRRCVARSDRSARPLYRATSGNNYKGRKSDDITECHWCDVANSPTRFASRSGTRSDVSMSSLPRLTWSKPSRAVGVLALHREVPPYCIPWVYCLPYVPYPEELIPAHWLSLTSTANRALELDNYRVPLFVSSFQLPWMLRSPDRHVPEVSVG